MKSNLIDVLISKSENFLSLVNSVLATTKHVAAITQELIEIKKENLELRAMINHHTECINATYRNQVEIANQSKQSEVMSLPSIGSNNSKPN